MVSFADVFNNAIAAKQNALANVNARTWLDLNRRWLTRRNPRAHTCRQKQQNTRPVPPSWTTQRGPQRTPCAKKKKKKVKNTRLLSRALFGQHLCNVQHFFFFQTQTQCICRFLFQNATFFISTWKQNITMAKNENRRCRVSARKPRALGSFPSWFYQVRFWTHAHIFRTAMQDGSVLKDASFLFRLCKPEGRPQDRRHARFLLSFALCAFHCSAQKAQNRKDNRRLLSRRSFNWWFPVAHLWTTSPFWRKLWLKCPVVWNKVKYCEWSLPCSFDGSLFWWGLLLTSLESSRLL